MRRSVATHGTRWCPIRGSVAGTPAVALRWGEHLREEQLASTGSTMERERGDGIREDKSSHLNRTGYLYGIKICGPHETMQHPLVRAPDGRPRWSISELNLFYKLLHIDTTKRNR